MVVSGGVVAYLQRMEPSLLRAHRTRAAGQRPDWVARDQAAVDRRSYSGGPHTGWGFLRRAQPGRVVHRGFSGARKLANQITAASADKRPPAHRLPDSKAWRTYGTLPSRATSPPYLKNTSLGYALSG